MAADVVARRLRRMCKCGLEVATTSTGRLRAHDCPHGIVCVAPFKARLKGVRGKQCPTCFAARQLELPYVG